MDWTFIKVMSIIHTEENKFLNQYVKGNEEINFKIFSIVIA